MTGDEFGNLISEFQVSDGGLSGGEFYHQFDAQADTNAIVDSDCAVVLEYRYQAFGLDTMRMHSTSIFMGSFIR